jgi:uncharacterized protein (TIGR02246 family)
MSDPDPSTIHDIFTRYYKAGDLDGCVNLYDDDAVFIGPDGTPQHGKAGVRATLEGFLALGGEFTLKTRYAVRTGELALTSNEWTLRGTGSDGQAFDLGGRSAEIVRLHPDGQWRFIVDHPWGGQ